MRFHSRTNPVLLPLHRSSIQSMSTRIFAGRHRSITHEVDPQSCHLLVMLGGEVLNIALWIWWILSFRARGAMRLTLPRACQAEAGTKVMVEKALMMESSSGLLEMLVSGSRAVSMSISGHKRVELTFCGLSFNSLFYCRLAEVPPKKWCFAATWLVRFRPTTQISRRIMRSEHIRLMLGDPEKLS